MSSAQAVGPQALPDLQAQVEQIIAEARRQGASACEVAVSMEQGLSTTVRQGEVETVEFNRDQGFGITLYVGQRKGSASTSASGEAAIRETVAAALAIAKHASEDDCAGLADAALMARELPDLDLYHPWAIAPEQAVELALACDRSYHLALPDDEAAAPKITVGEINFGTYPMATDQSRLARRFYDDKSELDAVRAQIGQPLDADAAFALGLVTANPDDIDWADEVRLAIEERVAMNPDALTGMEANLRFNGVETMATRVFGRLTAWQNWIFQRPNAVGEKGALKVYGTGEKSAFDWTRV